MADSRDQRAEALERIEEAAQTRATELSLRSMGLTELPPEIGKLTKLTKLNLVRNPLTALPPEIGKLTKLTKLNLVRNQLTALPPEIGKLTNLTWLDLSGNQLTALPPEIGKLTNLNSLDLFENQLTALPPEIGKLTNLTELYLHDNPGLNIPPEILGPTWRDVAAKDAKAASPQAILDYYFRTRAPGDRRALNEVKVILVGQGSVGKTSLVKRMVHNKFNKREKKTEGIYIEKAWSVPGKRKGERVQVNFWDFGGQEIMHATHQFFLTKRTVYLLVLDARKGENESNIHYWLKIIRSFGGDSPVLVVTNKCDAHHLTLNETCLQKDYPNIKGFFQTSCETGKGIEELKAGIEKQIRSGAMRHVFDPLPKEYFIVKQKLEKLAEARNYIAIREYYTLCHENDVAEQEDQDRLLRFLHDLGSVLSFNDPDSPLELREMNVLNPHWVTQGVYKILNDDTLAELGGVLTKADLPRILKGRKHPAESHPFIVEMMSKFELCFAVREREKWLVAELLPKNEPKKLGDWDDALRFQYHYDVLPSGIICRFIVRRYKNLTSRPLYWRSGVVLQMDGCKALVRSDGDRGRMHIAVTGPQNGRRALLSVLRDEFARIHGSIPNLQPWQMVPLPDNPDVTVEYEHLLTLEQQSVPDFIPPGVEQRYSVAKLLDDIEDPWMRYMISFHPPHFLIEPQTSFADAWEDFCCKALNLHNNTDLIRRRIPPETGIDLYWEPQQIAYQCKSVEDATGKLKTDKAEKSLRSALEIRSCAATPWKKYVICSNAPLTGTCEERLKAICEDVQFLTSDFWEPVCRKHWNDLQDRFRLISRHAGKIE